MEKKKLIQTGMLAMAIGASFAVRPSTVSADSGSCTPYHVEYTDSYGHNVICDGIVCGSQETHTCDDQG